MTPAGWANHNYSLLIDHYSLFNCFPAAQDEDAVVGFSVEAASLQIVDGIVGLVFVSADGGNVGFLVDESESCELHASSFEGEEDVVLAGDLGVEVDDGGVPFLFEEFASSDDLAVGNGVDVDDDT